MTGVVDREWFANVEYRYQTYLIVPEVCLKEDLTDQRVCNVKEAKTYFVSGAPLTVRSVEEDTAGKGIVALKIVVGNAGTGKSYQSGGKISVFGTSFHTALMTLLGNANPAVKSMKPVWMKLDRQK